MRAHISSRRWKLHKHKASRKAQALKALCTAYAPDGIPVKMWYTDEHERIAKATNPNKSSRGIAQHITHSKEHLAFTDGDIVVITTIPPTINTLYGYNTSTGQSGSIDTHWVSRPTLADVASRSGTDYPRTINEVYTHFNLPIS